MKRFIGKMKRAVLGAFIWLLLGINRMIILVVPFRHIAGWLGHEMEEADVSYTKDSVRRALVIGMQIRKAARRTPWESKCYPQALTAMEMMQVFGISYTVYFGIMREGSELKAHAWVKHGEVFVTGQAGHEQFHPVAYYGNGSK